jgi:hypothetical protein
MCVATLAIIGTVVSAAGTLGSGLYAAQVADNNSKIANQQGDYALAAANTKAQDEGVKNAQREAGIKTGQAASGIDVNSGSAVEVQASQRAVDQLDVERILQDGGLTAWGYRNQAKNFEKESEADTFSAITGTAATLFEKAPSMSWPGSKTGGNSWSTARTGVFG